MPSRWMITTPSNEKNTNIKNERPGGLLCLEASASNEIGTRFTSGCSREVSGATGRVIRELCNCVIKTNECWFCLHKARKIGGLAIVLRRRGVCARFVLQPTSWSEVGQAVSECQVAEKLPSERRNRVNFDRTLPFACSPGRQRPGRGICHRLGRRLHGRSCPCSIRTRL
eukprot:scaffold113127_cov18-Prasinocladus_malaysianus.AAC.2